ncbi:MAG: HAMP domain-containing protein [Bacteroidetes bacterium]|nr:MAG: HAMP domain-containing protein [Bacteroidota bacterium]REK00954.1 MAG: HAMP domain-containing protein [Bacteroidota bacterium]REK34557.1 MAG: HAMP domain-containing protein [Bacteroidota bacterium]REK51816.1 MAG: HAMP domain-containing protein [Bacteroidota bacterium]
MSIEHRIYLSFILLAMLFSINGFITISTLKDNKRMSDEISNSIEPALDRISNWREMIMKSKMYATNWVYLKTNKEDKIELIKIHKIEFPVLREKISAKFNEFPNAQIKEKVQESIVEYQHLQELENSIIISLASIEDYSDPEKFMTAQETLENEILIMSDYILATLTGLESDIQKIRNHKHYQLVASSTRLSNMILGQMLIIILLATFLATYMVWVITNPINNIKKIIADLGNGIIRKVNYKAGNDEIGQMIRYVNDHVDNLLASAKFAKSVGDRKFNTEFKPLSEHDVLGKSLLSMRDNLKQSDERLNESQQIAKLGNWWWSQTGKFQIWSDEVYRIFGIAPESIIPTDSFLFKMIGEENARQLKELRENCMVKGEQFSIECEVKITDNNSKHLLIQGKKVSNDSLYGDDIISGIIQDVTELKMYERTLVENNTNLTRVNKELDKFVYSVSHDLRAPLSSMAGVLEIMKDDTEDETILENINLLENSVNRLDRFIADILDYSRNSRTDAKCEEINFRDLLNEVKGNLKYMGDGTRQVMINEQLNESGTFHSDRTRINVVLNNLISNAIRYQKKESNVALVDVKIDLSDTEADIVVKDYGIGISRENQDKIFDMFFRVAKDSIGSGLGLYIVKETIEKLQGKI